MNITFFVGNGFDLNLGLNTKYADFYPYFCENANKSNMIREWIENDGDILWADLELSLGQHLAQVDISNQEKYYADKDELDELLLSYLGEEQSKFVVPEELSAAIADEMERSLNAIAEELNPEQKASIIKTFKAYVNEEYRYCFICFNYTNTLDRVVEITKRIKFPLSTHQGNGKKKNTIVDSVTHIHGTVDANMILGVNDESQVNNNFLRDNTLFLRTFIKKEMNSSLGEGRTEAVQKILDRSRIVCIFGMSLGQTDKMWWISLWEWLKKSENHKLIIFKRISPDLLKHKLPSKLVRLREKHLNEFLKSADVPERDIEPGATVAVNLEKIKDRIFFSYNSDIFNFNEVLKECQSAKTVQENEPSENGRN